MGTCPPSPAAALSMLPTRSEEHTSELQSLRHLVCRLLLEKKKTHSRRLSHYMMQMTIYIWNLSSICGVLRQLRNILTADSKYFVRMIASCTANRTIAVVCV